MNDASTIEIVGNKWIGRRTIRPDGADKVTGRAAYAADTTMPGMIWGKVLRSPHPHARILGIDTSKAERLPGVKAVITARDVVHFPVETPVPLGIQDMRWISRNVMAREKALFHGHPVAAVAATTEAIAAEACALIEVTYEVLPWAIDIDDALKPDAPILHESITFNGKPSNITGRLEHKLGDVEAGFAEADIVIERSFRTEPVHQGYIESHACLVSVAPDGKSTVWSSSQGQFMVRAMCAHLAGLPQSDIRAIPAEIGGGFGGKTIVYLEPLALLLSRKSGRPVKMVMSREEVFRATGPTSGSKSTVKIGATKDGRIVAAQGTFYLQAGALPGSPIRGAAGCAFAPYDIPNVLSVGYDVVSNRSKVAAYRAPGAPIGAYATECVLDEVAEALKMDPLEFRLKNAAREGTKAAHGPVFPRIGFVETIEAARAHPHYAAPLGKHQGRGVASGFWFNAGGESSAQVNITEDGNVVVTTGHPDIGGSRASTANIAAELLGIDYRRVSVLIGDTATVGYSNLTGGSRVTFASAMVVTQATEKVIATLRERAAAIWKIDPDAVKWENGEAVPAGHNAGRFPALTLAEIAARAGVAKGTVYLYYATKEEVFLELLAWRLGLWAEALIRWIEEGDAPLSAQELAEAYVAYPASNPATLKLAGLASAVLEANVAREVVIRFKTGQLERLRALGAAAARRTAGLDADRATQMFLRSYGYLLGIWQLSEAPAACRDAFSLPGLEALQMDFVHEATTGLRALWADLLD